MLALVTDPPAVVTVSGSAPLTACGGVTAVKLVGLTAVMFNSGVPPMLALIADEVVGKLVPVTVIVVPPWTEPADGVTVPIPAWAPIEYWPPVEVVCASRVEPLVVPLYAQMLYFGGVVVEAPLKKPVGMAMAIRFAEMIVRSTAGSTMMPPFVPVGVTAVA